MNNNMNNSNTDNQDNNNRNSNTDNRNNNNRNSNTDNRNNNNRNSNTDNRNNNNRNSGYKGNNYNSKYKNRNSRYNRGPVKSIEELENDYFLKKKNNKIEKPLCFICKEEIHIVEQAIKHQNTDELSHFDCVLKELNERNELEKFEIIVYLGGGTFGIIKERNTRGSTRFFIRKRIVYEKKDIYDYKLED